MTTFGDALKAMRQKRGLARLTLEELCGQGGKSVQAWESSTYEPRLESLRRIAGVLRCTIAVMEDGRVEFIPSENLKGRKK